VIVEFIASFAIYESMSVYVHCPSLAEGV